MYKSKGSSGIDSMWWLRVVVLVLGKFCRDKYYIVVLNIVKIKVVLVVVLVISSID